MNIRNEIQKLRRAVSSTVRKQPVIIYRPSIDNVPVDKSFLDSHEAIESRLGDGGLFVTLSF